MLAQLQDSVTVALSARVGLGARAKFNDAEFGLELSEETEIHVWDSTAELRYMVLPERPAGTQHMSEQELAGLVTRDSMVGVAKVTAAKSGAAP